jgi:hypothetical protein
MDIPQISRYLQGFRDCLKELEINLKSSPSPNLATARCKWPKSRHRQCLITLEGLPNYVLLSNLLPLQQSAYWILRKRELDTNVLIKVTDVGLGKRVTVEPLHKRPFLASICGPTSSPIRGWS